jgi:Synergist-CTERM protein sorting domain-containing protein
LGHRVGILLLLLLMGLLSAFAAYGSLGTRGASPGGSGSYATTTPVPGTKPNGSTVNAVPPACAPNVDLPVGDTRKVPTNDWWTPLAWVDSKDLPDQVSSVPMRALTWEIFSEPLVFQPQKGGLALSFNIPDSQKPAMVNKTLTPGAGFMQEVVGTESAGGPGISPYFNTFFDQDLYLGSTASGWNEASFDQVKVTGWSDWFVNFTMRASSGTSGARETMAFTAGNGSPFVLVSLDRGLPQVTFRTWNVGTVIPLTGSSFNLNAGQAKAQTIPCEAFAVINKVPGTYNTYTVYGVFGPKGSTWTLNDSQYIAGQRKGPFDKWKAGHGYKAGEPVEPVSVNSHDLYFTATPLGISQSQEPAWPKSENATVADGTVLWTAHDNSSKKEYLAWSSRSVYRTGDPVVPKILNGFYYVASSTEPIWPSAAGGSVTDGTVFWMANSLIEKIVQNTATCSLGKHYAVAVLPYPWGKGIYDEPDQTKVKALLAEFAKHVFAKVTDTKVTPVYVQSASESDVKATYSYTTVAVGNETPATDGPLTALYPHQYVGQPQVKILNGSMAQVPASSWSQGWYWPSLKGPMVLASGGSFVNQLEVPPCLPAVVDAPTRIKADRMEAYLRQAMDSRDPHFLSQGSYFGAQQMHRLAMLLPIAAMIRPAATSPASVDQDAKNIYGAVADAMGYWLRATRSDGTAKTAADSLFYYDSRWGSMIPTPEDGFAADSLLNDHHYHYGYFVKIATELARWEKAHPNDPANRKWAAAYAPMIKLLIRDIANTGRAGTGTNPDFPFLRNFSPYAGHSWASGSSRGNRGGQQESTPEAIQAWAALLLWAQLDYPHDADNAVLETWAAYMFASEAKSARMYWFGFTDQATFRPYLSFRQYTTRSTTVPKPYRASMVSQINQNEMTFQTDFGNQTLLKYGIQWLPLTGSSLYLGTRSADAEDNVAGYFKDYAALGAGATPPSNKDKLLMMEALTSTYRANPKTLITIIGNVASPLDTWRNQWQLPTPTYDNLILQDTSRGAMYWWIDTILNHGVPHHANVGADHASAACFRNESGDMVYTAHNPTDSTLRVTFADGKVLDVPSLGYVHEEVKTGTAEGSGGGCSAWFSAPMVLLLLLPLVSLRRR